MRSRRLRPGPGAEPGAVETNQRERLMAAMVAAVDEHGYEAARVADVVKLSGVSRSAFYGYFEDKLDCFLATADAIAELAAARVAAAVDPDASWERRLHAAADEFVALILAQPAAARLCLVEIYAAGPRAVERLDGATDAVEHAVSSALRESPERSGMPREMVRAIVGGLNKAVYSRLRRRELEDLPQVVSELLEWGLSYRTPPQPLRRPRRRPARPEPQVPDAGEPRARLIRATAEVIVDNGYPNATIAEIAERAKASLSTFYARFDTKEAAFRAAIAQAQAETVAAAAPAYHAAPGWRRAIRDGLDAMLGHLAGEPVTARIAVVEVLAAGSEALDQGDQTIRAIDEYLAPGFERSAGTPRIVAEAVGGALYTLVYSEVRLGRGERMRELTPTATYLALAPFDKPAKACEIANEPLRGR